MLKKACTLFLIMAFMCSSVFIVQTQADSSVIQRQKFDTGGDRIYDCSLVLDSLGNPHVSYRDGTPSGSTGLKYAAYDGNTWTFQSVEDGGITGLNGGRSSLSLDANGNPCISYLGYDLSYHSYLRYAYWNGQAWVCQTVDPQGYYVTSLALDSNGNPHITYVQGYSLAYASWNGAKWDIETVAAGIYMQKVIGSDSSLQIDKNNVAHLSFYDDVNECLKYATRTSGGWIIETVDTDSQAGIDNSLALNSNGYPCISYRYEDGLRYASWDGSHWNKETIDVTGGDEPQYEVGKACSLALDSTDAPHISYIDSYRISILKYATFNGSSWKIYGMSEQACSGYCTQIAVDPSDNVHIVHNDYTQNVMEYIHFNPKLLPEPSIIPDPPPMLDPGPYYTANSAAGTPLVVDQGYFPSIALDDADNPHVAYSGNYGLMYSYSNGSMWRGEVVDLSGWLGLYPSIALDANCNPHITYLDNINHTLKYAWYDGSQWTKQVLDPEVGSWSSLVIDSRDYPHVAYIDPINSDLKYAEWNGTTWNFQVVDSVGWIGGNPSLALDSNEQAHVAYYDITNKDLKYASQTNAGWAIQRVDSDGDVGQCTSLKIDIDNNAHISYLDNTNQQLKYANSSTSGWTIQNIVYIGSFSRQGQFNQTSLVLDSNNQPHIGYLDGINNNLKYTYWNGTHWLGQTADSTYNTGFSPSLALDSSGNAHIAYCQDVHDHLRYIKSADPTGFGPTQVLTTTQTPSPNSSPTPTPSPSQTSPTPSSTPKPAQTPTPTPMPTQIPTTSTAPTLTVSCIGKALQTTIKVEISGNLAENGLGIASAPIHIAYSTTNGNSWQALTTVSTEANGRFSAEWLPNVTGNYLIKATYLGTATQSPVSITVNLVITPNTSNDKETVFSVSSNSSVSDLAFNSEPGQLSFSVSGPTNTTGYVDICIDKALVSDASKISAYIDGNAVNYTVTSTADSWVLHFSYHHSTHMITLNLNNVSNDALMFSSLWLIFLGIAVVVGAVAIIKKRRR